MYTRLDKTKLTPKCNISGDQVRPNLVSRVMLSVISLGNFTPSIHPIFLKEYLINRYYGIYRAVRNVPFYLRDFWCYIRTGHHLSDFWCPYSHTSKFILPLLKTLKENRTGIPSCFVNYDSTSVEQCKKSVRKWNNVLDKIIFSHQWIYDEDFTTLHPYKTFDPKEYQKTMKKVQEGLNLFGKYYMNLWD